MNCLLDEAGVQLWHGDGEAFVLGRDLSDAVVMADLPYGAKSYETDVEFDDTTIRHLLTARTSALFGWPEDLMGLAGRLSLPRPGEFITWWAPNKCDPRANDLREAEAIAIWGEVTRERRNRITRPRSEACKAAMERIGRYPDRRRPTSSKSTGKARVSNGPMDIAQDGSVWRINAPGIGFNAANRLHPNEKPRELLERLVLLCSEPGDLIIDPCCGSGTTLEAARKLGRRAIGVECVERHCRTTMQRLSQQALFAARSP